MDIRELATTDYATLKRHPWEETRLQVIADKLKKATATLQKDEIWVLDMGCGDAYVAYRLALIFSKFHFLCVDTAFTPELRTKLKDQIRSDRVTLIANLNEAEASYTGAVDLVFLFDLIEHIENDVDFLKELRTSPLFSDDTKIFITVPAFQFLFSNHDVFLKHYRRYTIGTLKNAVAQAGFKDTASGYFFFGLLLPRLLQQLFEKRNQSRAKGVGNYQGCSLKRALIKSILVLDYYFFNIFTGLGIKVPGLSCYMICKRDT